MRLLKGKFAKHMISALLAQGFSLLQSTFMTFIVAKILDQSIFAWWQWFLFLAGLTHYIHIGVGEGILLKYGGESYDKLNHRKIGIELRSYALLQIICAVLICVLGVWKFHSTNEGICVVLTGIYLFSYNITYFLSQILISTNRTSEYSTAVIVDKVILFITSLLLILMDYKDYIMFAVLYTTGQYIELLICALRTKEIVRCTKCTKPTIIKGFMYCFKDASSGFFLSLSTFLANQITGIGRLFIRIFNGLLDFGTLSIASSLCNFILIFIRQIGIVIFPFLRESNEVRRRALYQYLYFIIEILTLASLLLYYPLRFILEKWLTQYSDSFVYMAYIMPIIVLDSQMSALNTPYLNAMRKERILLLINAASLIVTIICTVIAIKVFNSIEFVALSISIGMAVKDFSSYVYLCKKYNNLNYQSIIQLVVLTLMLGCFIATARFFSFASMMVYVTCFVTYCVIQYNNIKEIYKKLINISAVRN